MQVILIECQCPEDVSRERVNNRKFPLQPFDPQAHDRIRALYEPIGQDELDNNSHISFLTYDTHLNVVNPLRIREAHQQDVQRIMNAII